MKIITISREFASGGRELGKRLAQRLGFDYYDREIVTAIARRCAVNEDYAEYLLGNRFSAAVNITMHQSFQMTSVLESNQLQLLRAQTEVIKEVARLGRDAVIVGRNADLLLEEYHPFCLFVCAELPFKLQRCRERAQAGENLTEKEMIQKMKTIDKNRRKTREMISDSVWGSREAYHLIVNTSGWSIKELTPHVADFAMGWFQRNEKNA